MRLVPGARLGRYEVVGLVGAGAMGEVYRARDPELEREVAIKVLPAELAEEPLRLQRFERDLVQMLAPYPRIKENVV